MYETVLNVSRTLRSVWPPASKFSVDQMPSLQGKVAIVTGANTGVGKETVKALLQRDAKVYLAARSQTKAEEAIKDLKASTGKEAVYLPLNLASLAAVRESAQTFLTMESELHILFNNAGVMKPPINELTEEGFDMQFGTNVVGHWLFTELLLPALAAGAKNSPDGYARVVTTSSSGAHLAPKMVAWDTFKDGPARTKLGSQMLYFQSKLLNAVVAHEASKRYASMNILSFACDPGALKTDLQRHGTPTERWLGDLMLQNASYGALTQLWAGTMPETVQYNGQFLIPYARVGRTQNAMYEPETGRKLWEYLEHETMVTRS